MAGQATMRTAYADNFRMQVVPDENPDTSWLEQKGSEDRLSQYRAGMFGFVGVQAVCDL